MPVLQHYTYQSDGNDSRWSGRHRWGFRSTLFVILTSNISEAVWRHLKRNQAQIPLLDDWSHTTIIPLDLWGVWQECWWDRRDRLFPRQQKWQCFLLRNAGWWQQSVTSFIPHELSIMNNYQYLTHWCIEQWSLSCWLASKKRRSRHAGSHCGAKEPSPSHLSCTQVFNWSLVICS